MKIISRFKDYYDFIAYQYGVDEKIIFERKLCPSTNGNLERYGYLNPNRKNKIHEKDQDLIFHCYSNKAIDLKYYHLFICGRRFLIEYFNNSWKVVERNSDLLKELYIPHNYLFRNDKKKFDKLQQGVFQEDILKFNIKHKSPIIVVDKYSSYYKESPVLGEILGFVKLYPSEQIYQDISYFLSNQVNGSPDLDPEVVLDNKYKILYHGFDGKSFKHRKGD